MNNRNRPDIYIGLVAAAGTDLSTVIRELTAQLSIIGYDTEHIKVSNLIRSFISIPEWQNEFDRLFWHMKAGDAIRSASDDGIGVASLAIREIIRRRDGQIDGSSKAFIIDSLKHPNEIALFDQIYVRNYYTVAIYTPHAKRLENLQIKICRDSLEPPNRKSETSALRLIRADEKSKGAKSQNVRDSFPKADFFMYGEADLTAQAKRFVEIIFGEPYTTPTIDEFAMFMARGTGYRSADLSRQVGAVIVDPCGSIIGTGCNEVPYPGGGFFSEGTIFGIGDNRDHVKQIDPNFAEIQRILIEVVQALREAGQIGDGSPNNSADVRLVDSLLQGEQKDLLSDKRIRSLIEFGRIVHAEMHAICDAAAGGRPVRGSTLYCTTFPCHLCAKHIIASGIKEVVYIEPYPKSLTAQLYADEIEVTHSQQSNPKTTHFDRVRFRPFNGVAPVLFQRAFRYRPRKDSRGLLASWNPQSALPSGAVGSVDRPSLEASKAEAVSAIHATAKTIFDAQISSLEDDDP